MHNLLKMCKSVLQSVVFSNFLFVHIVYYGWDNNRLLIRIILWRI